MNNDFVDHKGKQFLLAHCCRIAVMTQHELMISIAEETQQFSTYLPCSARLGRVKSKGVDRTFGHFSDVLVPKMFECSIIAACYSGGFGHPHRSGGHITRAL